MSLVAQIDELERKANAYRVSVNVLCEKDGIPPIYPDAGGSGGGGARPGNGHREAPNVATSIKPDAFYGKRQQTAVRELLSIRRAQTGEGPAKPAEILAGLKAGGYQVEATTDEIALVGLRAMLRKRSAVFLKLPNGTWALREWYPHPKPPKDAGDKSASPKETAAPASDGAGSADVGGKDEIPATDTPKEASAA